MKRKRSKVRNIPDSAYVQNAAIFRYDGETHEWLGKRNLKKAFFYRTNWEPAEITEKKFLEVTRCLQEIVLWLTVK